MGRPTTPASYLLSAIAIATALATVGASDPAEDVAALAEAARTTLCDTSGAAPEARDLLEEAGVCPALPDVAVVEPDEEEAVEVTEAVPLDEGPEALIEDGVATVDQVLHDPGQAPDAIAEFLGSIVGFLRGVGHAISDTLAGVPVAGSAAGQALASAFAALFSSIEEVLVAIGSGLASLGVSAGRGIADVAGAVAGAAVEAGEGIASAFAGALDAMGDALSGLFGHGSSGPVAAGPPGAGRIAQAEDAADALLASVRDLAGRALG